MNPEHCDMNRRHPEHRHLTMREFAELYSSHHPQPQAAPQQAPKPEATQAEVVGEEPIPEERISHRRDDQEIIHERFKHIEEQTPGIYMGLEHGYHEKEIFPRPHV